jgi:hypothetical protein
VARPATAAASGTVASTRICPGSSASFRFVRFSDCARKGTARITIGPRAAAAAFSRPSTAASGTRSRTRPAASSARSALRDPIATGTPARASRSASPNPSAPVPPTIGTGEGASTAAKLPATRRR